MSMIAFLEELLRGKPADHPACVWSKGAGSRYPLNAAAAAARDVPELGADPYVAVSFLKPGAGAKLGRRRRTSNATAAGIYGLWLDLDVKPGGAPNLGAAEALAWEIAEPTLVVATGGGLHVWHLFGRPWLFADDDDRDAATALAVRWQEAHRRAAGWNIDPTADLARVLRIPGTVNTKYGKTARLLDDSIVRARLHNGVPHCAIGPRHPVNDLAAAVEHIAAVAPKATAPYTERSDGGAVRNPETGAVLYNDPLLKIPATTYVPLLTRQEPGRDRKIRCPFHDDAEPSLHVYDGPGRGWFCFGCRRGGSIFDFGAALYGLEPRGSDFHNIRRRLAADLLETQA